MFFEVGDDSLNFGFVLAEQWQSTIEQAPRAVIKCHDMMWSFAIVYTL